MNENCFNCALFKWDEWRQGNFPCEYYSEKMYLYKYQTRCDYYIPIEKKRPRREDLIKKLPVIFRRESYTEVRELRSKLLDLEGRLFSIELNRMYHPKYPQNNAFSVIVATILIILSIMVTTLFCTILKFGF